MIKTMLNLNKKLVIIAHVPSPNMQILRDAVISGANNHQINGVDILTLCPFDANADDILTADGVIFGTTENLGYISGTLKDFFDRCYYSLLNKKPALPILTYIRAGHDGTGSKIAIETILKGLRWKLIQPPIILKGDWDDDFIKQCEIIGMTMAAGLEAGIY